MVANFDLIGRRETIPKSRLLRGIIGELMGLPEDHPAVARGCISVIAPCLMLLVFDRGTLKQVFPELGFDPENAKNFVPHLVQFALAGLEAVGREAQKNLAQFERRDPSINLATFAAMKIENNDESSDS